MRSSASINRLSLVDEVAHTKVMAKTIKVGDCVLWTGRRSSSGHGVVHYATMAFPVHRVVFEYMKGAVRPDDVVAHTCGNKLCVRIEHLFVVNKKDFLRKKEVGNLRACP